MNFSTSFRALVAALLAAGTASAVSISYNFDSASAGSLASAFNTADFSFHNGTYAPLTDSFGDVISGSDQWQIDSNSDTAFPVLIQDPSNFGYGSAPSGSLALMVIDQTVLISFGFDVNISTFSVTLDNSTLGNLIPTNIDFVNGSTVAFSQSIDQTVSGLVVNVGAVSGVRSIVLPTTAFYDNLSITYSAIPEPSSYAVLAGMAGLGAVAQRRRRKSV